MGMVALTGIEPTPPKTNQSCKVLAILTKSATEVACIFRITWPR